MRTIQQVWDTYYQRVMKPAGVPVDSVQYRETQLGFYGGAVSMFGLIVMEVTELPDDEGAAALLRIRAEIDELAAQWEAAAAREVR